MDEVTLRAFEERDLPFLDRLCTDPDAMGASEWRGFTDPRSRRKRWEQDAYVGAESTALAVVVPDGTVVGLASRRQGDYGGPAGVCYEIGLVLLPEHRPARRLPRHDGIRRAPRRDPIRGNQGWPTPDALH